MSAKYPEPLMELIDLLKTLPGVGKRSAERLAFSMLKWQSDKLEALGENLKTLKEKVTDCPECGNLSCENKICPICASASRDRRIICVVEEAAQICNIEESALFKGLYHVLGGKLSPLDGKGADNLATGSLKRRIESSGATEIILAFSSDVEGQATAAYVAEFIRGTNAKVTRLAQGLPAGSDISYADSATIAVALNGRTSV